MLGCRELTEFQRLAGLEGSTTAVKPILAAFDFLETRTYLADGTFVSLDNASGVGLSQSTLSCVQ